MELIRKVNDEVTIGEFDDIKSGIDAANIGLALSMVSKNLYSNPIGSVIREIVSNGVDANVDAGANKPVLVTIQAEDGNWYFSVKDNGTGISPDKFKNIYMNWFSSDKRKDNTKIGGWGLGSKSPLAYQDEFELTTWVDGMKYEYIIYESDPLSTATLVNTEETTQSNGTLVKLLINPKDTYTFHKECEKQLAYFDDVYVKNYLYTYNNDFTIFDSKLFKLRDVGSPYPSVHICLGQVSYPIDWATIGRNAVNLPIALNFEVGDLPVVLSRENIDYGKGDAITKIQNALDTLIADLNSRYLQKDVFTDFVTAIYSVYKRKDYKITIGTVQMSINEIVDTTKIINKLPGTEYIITEQLVELLLNIYSIQTISGGAVSNQYNNKKDLASYLQTKSVFYRKGDWNTYDSKALGSGIVISRKALTLDWYRKLVKIIAPDKLIAKPHSRYAYRTVYNYTESMVKTVSNLIKYFDGEIQKNSHSYDGYADEEWITNYKYEQKALRDSKKEVFTYYNEYKTRRSRKLYVQKGIIVFYINVKANTPETIMHYKSLLQLLPAYYKPKIEYILVNPSVIPKLKRQKGYLDVSSIFLIKDFKNIFYRFMIHYNYAVSTKNIILSNVYSKEINIIDNYFKKTVKKRYTDLGNTVSCNIDNVYEVHIDLVKFFEFQLKNIKPSNKYIFEIEKLINNYQQKVVDYDILQYINYDCPKHYLKPILLHFVLKYKDVRMINKIL